MKKRLFWLLIFATLLLMLACSLPAPAPTATAGALAKNNAYGGGNGAQNHLSGAATPKFTSTPPTATPTATLTPSPTPTPTPTPPAGGPYVVKQTQTLGGETISGSACKLTLPFLVNVASPKVTFNFNFVPSGHLGGGTWSYAYNIASAGETHDAKGTYKLAPPKHDGTVVLTMTGSDHVVFHGFDGRVPSRYSFDLIPTSVPGC